jgi:imidazole glycerol phosphate synthase subunit HisF
MKTFAFIFARGGSINYYAIDNPFFISESSKKFGSQYITVSIHVKIHETGEYEVFTLKG